MLKSPFTVIQECCISKGCEGGADIPEQDLPGGRIASGSSSLVLQDADGNLIVPLSVGGASSGVIMDTFLEDHGLNASSMVQERSASGVMVFKKRDAPRSVIEKRVVPDTVLEKKEEPKVLEKRECTFTHNEDDRWTASCR